MLKIMNIENNVTHVTVKPRNRAAKARRVQCVMHLNRLYGD